MRVGNKLYKYQDFGNFAEYIVTAVIKRNRLIQYELECQSCDHGFKCLVLDKKTRGRESYEFLACVNDEEEEYRAWHTTHTAHEEFFPTLYDAKIAVYKNAISKKENKIKDAKERLSSIEKELKDLLAHYENIKKEIEL